jgi:hypothetical protein
MIDENSKVLQLYKKVLDELMTAAKDDKLTVQQFIEKLELN